MAEPHLLWGLPAAGLSIIETPLAICVLRVRAPDAALSRALGAALALAWPDQPNTTVAGPVRVAWLAPGEWAILAPATEIAERVAAACQDHTHHLADLSAGRRLWRIDGPQSRALLAKGCGLDTHPSVLGPGRCAQSLLAQIPVLLMPKVAGAAFDIVADASFTGHLRAWFSASTLEFQA